MYGAILRKGEEYYTYLHNIFFGINMVQKNYNWLITDIEVHPKTKEYNNLFSKRYMWLSGEGLTNIIEKENFQWIWGVLSGFDKNIDIKEVLNYSLPYADGYKGFWQNPLSLQHPLVAIETVAWDSSLSLVISKEKKIIDDFRSAFPLSEDLEVYNKKSVYDALIICRTILQFKN